MKQPSKPKKLENDSLATMKRVARIFPRLRVARAMKRTARVFPRYSRGCK